MEIVLVRHGQPEWVVDGLTVGDPPLTERGRRQVEAVARTLAAEPFDEVYCSPLVRARESAAPLFEALGRPETIAPWLEEIRNPMWHGTPAEKTAEAFEEERRRPSSDRWRGLEHLGGEHVGEFVARIREGCGLFLAERGIQPVQSEFALWSCPDPDRRIALVAHGGTNAVVICHLLGLTPVPWEWDRFTHYHAGITRLASMPVAEGHIFALSKLSDIEHLTPEDRTI